MELSGHVTLQSGRAEVEVIAVALPSLCEFGWALRRAYKSTTSDVTKAIRALVSVGNVQTNRPAIEAGLAVLEAGGDFADGVSAFEGEWLDGDTFVSFDRTAVEILSTQGYSARLL